MAIDSLDRLVKGMTNGKQYTMQRATVTSMVSGQPASLWKGTGFPAQGAIPAAAAICTNTTTGAFPLPSKAAGEDRVLAQLQLYMSTSGHVLTIEDRLMHMGGLNGTLLTAQAANISLFNNLANNNLAERIGESDYSEVQWYLEWYTATGATVCTPTAQCTFHDGTTGNVNVDVAGGTALPATVGSNRRYRLAPTNGKFIRSVESVTLSASTGTVGNFGVTAVRPRALSMCPTAGVMWVIDWATLGCPKLFDQSCITFGQICATTNTGNTQANLLIAVA